MGERRALRGVLTVDYSYGVSPRRGLLRFGMRQDMGSLLI